MEVRRRERDEAIARGFVAAIHSCVVSRKWQTKPSARAAGAGGWRRAEAQTRAEMPAQRERDRMPWAVWCDP